MDTLGVRSISYLTLGTKYPYVYIYICMCMCVYILVCNVVTSTMYNLAFFHVIEVRYTCLLFEVDLTS